MYLVYSMLGNW